MDKRLLIIVLLPIALASCSQITDEHRIVPEPMVFSAVASHSMKSIITTTNYPVDEPFAVESVFYPDDSDAVEAFMTGEIVTYDKVSGHWKTRRDYYWPEAGTLHFYAGSPVLPEVSVSAERGVETDWAIPTTAYAQTDLCFGEVVENCSSHSLAVPIVFSHALSQVCFKARPLKFYSYSQRVDSLIQSNVIRPVLDSVKISGIVSKGHFSQTPVPGWVIDKSTTATYQLYRSDSGLALYCDDYANPILTQFNQMLLIPQEILKDATLEEWHHTEIRTSVTNTNTGEIVSDIRYEIPGSAKFQLAKSCKRWNMDYKYTFRLAIGMEESELVATVTDWTETKEIILGDE